MCNRRGNKIRRGKERNKKKRKWTDLIDCASVSTYFSYSSLYRWMFWNEIVFIIFPWEEDEWQMWFGETLKWVFFLSWPETRCIARHLGALTLFTFPSLDYLMEYVHFGNFSKLFEREISRGKVFFFLYSRCRGLDNCLVDVLPRNQLFLLLLLVLYANEASQTARERERASQHAIGRVLLPSALRGHYDVLFSFFWILFIYFYFLLLLSLGHLHTREDIFKDIFLFSSRNIPVIFLKNWNSLTITIVFFV